MSRYTFLSCFHFVKIVNSSPLHFDLERLLDVGGSLLVSETLKG